MPVARAVIFDMDGVLVDSEPLHQQVTREVLGGAATPAAEATAREFIGRSVSEMLRTLVRRYGLRGPLSDYETRYDVLLRSLLAQPRPPREGTIWLLSELRRRGCRLGLASSSLSAWVDAMLRSLGLAGKFDAVVGGDMVAQGKPAPDVYLLAAERLEVPPNSCVAVEDSPAGVEAARTAGMTVVALVTPHVEAGRLGGANRLIGSLLEFPLVLVEAPRSIA